MNLVTYKGLNPQYVKKCNNNLRNGFNFNKYVIHTYNNMSYIHSTHDITAVIIYIQYFNLQK